jgi:hypothetical protein
MDWNLTSRSALDTEFAIHLTLLIYFLYLVVMHSDNIRHYQFTTARRDPTEEPMA